METAAALIECSGVVGAALHSEHFVHGVDCRD
jgi:hypothetical protein